MRGGANRRGGSRAAKVAFAGALAAAVVLPAAGAAQVQPYGHNDAGGFRNVLPPGAAGTDNAAQFGAFQAAGTYPDHWIDQQSLYEGLVQAAASPGFGEQEVFAHFKDATFGVPEGEVESTISPRPGVTIIRDSGYGVPHIYGQTRPDTMFGVGYASAQDRLFLMDILRHTARAQLSSFIGGSDGNREMDRTQWQLAPYTEADLQAQIDGAGELYGPEGEQVVEDVEGYVAGINAYIERALVDPTLMPAEYTVLGKSPEPWKPTDLMAEASLIGAIFSVGGGARAGQRAADAAVCRSLRGARRPADVG